MDLITKTKVIAEIGINYAFCPSTGDFVNNVKKLIDVAVVAGAVYVRK